MKFIAGLSHVPESKRSAAHTHTAGVHRWGNAEHIHAAKVACSQKNYKDLWNEIKRLSKFGIIPIQNKVESGVNTAKSRFISLPNLCLHVLDWGGTADRIMIFLHGLASTAHMFDLIASHFTRAYHVYAVDQRGHGLSDAPSQGYEFESIARDLDDLLSIINPEQKPVTFVGHSWGAHVALHYAATRSIENLMLLDGAIRPLSENYPTWEEANVKMAPQRYQNRSITDVEAFIEQKWLRGIYRPELKPLALSVFDSSNSLDVRPRLSYDNHMQIAHALWAFHPSAYFKNVNYPTLIIAAVADEPEQTLKQHLQRAAADFPHSETVIMTNTAHDIPWHRPLELVGIMDAFLKDD